MKKLVFFVMSIVLIVLLCSCATLQLAPRFTLSEPIICLTMPEGYGKYEVNVNRRCNQNFPFWIYLELNNITIERAADGYCHFTNRLLTVTDSNDTVVMHWPVHEYRRIIEQERGETLDRVYTWYWIFPPHPQSGLKCGTYTATIWVEDIYSEQSDEVSIEFTLIEGLDI